jgi:hypothetical protein
LATTLKTRFPMAQLRWYVYAKPMVMAGFDPGVNPPDFQRC